MLERALAGPSKLEGTAVPAMEVHSTAGRIDWDIWHDPRVARAWDGTDSPKFRAALAHVRAERQGTAGPKPEPPCPLCRGLGHRDPGPEALGWAPCTACHAEEFFRLAARPPDFARSAGRADHAAPGLVEALAQARQRVVDCTECGGTGRVFPQRPQPNGHKCPAHGQAVCAHLPACSLCHGTGKDPDVAWRNETGLHEQRTMAATPGMETPAGELPTFLQVRRFGAVQARELAAQADAWK